MRINTVMALLVGVLICLAVGGAWLSVRYYFSLKQLQRYQGRYLQMSQAMTAVRALAADCMRYSQSNSSINPILQQFELKPGTNQVADLPEPLPNVNP